MQAPGGQDATLAGPQRGRLTLPPSRCLASVIVSLVHGPAGSVD